METYCKGIIALAGNVLRGFMCYRVGYDGGVGGDR